MVMGVIKEEGKYVRLGLSWNYEESCRCVKIYGYMDITLFSRLKYEIFGNYDWKVNWNKLGLNRCSMLYVIFRADIGFLRDILVFDFIGNFC